MAILEKLGRALRVAAHAEVCQNMIGWLFETWEGLDGMLGNQSSAGMGFQTAARYNMAANLRCYDCVRIYLTMYLRARRLLESTTKFLNCRACCNLLELVFTLRTDTDDPNT